MSRQTQFTKLVTLFDPFLFAVTQVHLNRECEGPWERRRGGVGEKERERDGGVREKKKRAGIPNCHT